MTLQIVPAQAEDLLTWAGLLAALQAGHRLPKPDIKDLFVYRGGDTILDRATWIDGLGAPGQGGDGGAGQRGAGQADRQRRGDAV